MLEEKHPAIAEGMPNYVPVWTAATPKCRRCGTKNGCKQAGEAVFVPVSWFNILMNVPCCIWPGARSNFVAWLSWALCVGVGAAVQGISQSNLIVSVPRLVFVKLNVRKCWCRNIFHLLKLHPLCVRSQNYGSIPLFVRRPLLNTVVISYASSVVINCLPSSYVFPW